MSTATAARPVHVPAAAKHAAKASNAFAGDRPLNPDEYDLARAFVRRWQSARSLVVKLCGSADATSEYLTAVERYEAFEGDELAYMRAALKDRDMLSPDELMSYARFAAFSVAEPHSVDRATWAMLRGAEVDIVRLIEALNAGAEGFSPVDGANLVIDGRRFSVAYLDQDFDPRDARLIVESLPGARRDDVGDVLAN